MPDLTALDAITNELDDAIGRADSFAAKVDRLRTVARLPLSAAALAAVQGAIADHDAQLAALHAAVAKVEAARAALVAARHAIATLASEPTQPARQVSASVAAEFVALTVELDRTVALFVAEPAPSDA